MIFIKFKIKLIATKFYYHLAPNSDSGTEAKTDNLKPISL